MDITDPRTTVLQATDHLASRLDAIISDVLAPHLNGLGWDAVLRELDARRGYPPKLISRNDLQAQLRILTERLGALGYPFDDGSRMVGTLGSELRTVRRNLAHTNPFTALEAWRATDHCVRLLELFDDREGLVRASELRQEAFATYAEESGIAPAPARREEPFVPVATAGEPAGRDVEQAAMPEREHDSETLHDAAGNLYEPWPGGLAGDVEVLDTIARNASKAQVRALAEEIVEFEGPVAVGRLISLVGHGFGLTKVHQDRRARIKRQIPSADVYLDEHGFVWTSREARETWNGFRTTPTGTSRPIEDISPKEIANAWAAVRAERPGMSDQEGERVVLGIFGRSKMTAPARRQLALARALL